MPTWLSNASTPAWVQAVGSVLAILVAVWIPARQRSNLLRDAQAERTRQEKEHRRRLTVGLRAEINAALEAANRHEFTIEHALKGLQEARAKGAVIKTGEPIQPGSLVLTDAIVYRQIAAELGQLPPELIKSVVLFYTLALDLGRMADGAPTALAAYETIRGVAPRLKMHAALLISTLDKFEASDFAVAADIRPKPDEIRKLAAKVGYPLDQVMKERGLST
jgi:heme exporter protein D